MVQIPVMDANILMDMLHPNSKPLLVLPAAKPRWKWVQCIREAIRCKNDARSGENSAFDTCFADSHKFWLTCWLYTGARKSLKDLCWTCGRPPYWVKFKVWWFGVKTVVGSPIHCHSQPSFSHPARRGIQLESTRGSWPVIAFTLTQTRESHRPMWKNRA